MSDLKNVFCRPTEERVLLAACMHNINNYFTICAKLSAIDFLFPQHELLMLIFSTLVAKGAGSLESNLVIAEASASGIIDSIGGAKYIQTVSNMNIETSNMDIYLGAVYEASVKYKLLSMLESKAELVTKNAKEGLSSTDLVSNAEASIMDLTMSGLGINEPINLSNGLTDYIDERKANLLSLSGMSTGYPILDKQIDGMIDGTLLVMAARKKMGKSTLLSNISAHVAYRLGVPVLYVDTELTFKEWRPRLLSILSGVKERDIKYGGYDAATYARLQKAAKLIEKGRMFHEYMPGYTVDKLVALYKKYRHKEKIGLIVFDYLKEPESSSIDKQRKDYQILGDVTTKLKDLAGSLGIPALTAVQLNRDNDIADSDRIARYADVVCVWSNRKVEEIEAGGLKCGTHKLVIRDTRRGGTTGIEGIGYNFNKERLSIREVPVDEQYFFNFEKTVNSESSSEESYVDYEL